jgi:hypothetical protein
MSDKNPTCFVAMPITTPPEVLALYGNDKDHFIHVLEHLFSPAIVRSGHSVIRPIITGSDVIHASIIRNLEEADLVLCDISLHNPNVFFELGVRTALDRPVVLVKDDKTEELPFDTSIINTFSYNSYLNPWTLEAQIANMSEHIKAAASQDAAKNSLWQYFGKTKRAGDVVPVDAPSLEGHWYGDFGNVYFKVQGNTAKAVYDYGDGRILGTIHDEVLDGWWNELPTRSPSNHAGLVHFEMRKGSKTLRLDGAWLLGRSGNWKTWTLTKVDEDIPPSAQAKLDESSTFTSG